MQELGRFSGGMYSEFPLADAAEESNHCKPEQTTREKYHLASSSSTVNILTDDGQLQWVKAWQRVEVGVICVVIAVVWGLLSLPVIFYHIPQVSSQYYGNMGLCMQFCSLQLALKLYFLYMYMYIHFAGLQ